MGVGPDPNKTEFDRVRDAFGHRKRMRFLLAKRFLRIKAHGGNSGLV